MTMIIITMIMMTTCDDDHYEDDDDHDNEDLDMSIIESFTTGLLVSDMVC